MRLRVIAVPEIEQDAAFERMGATDLARVRGDVPGIVVVTILSMESRAIGEVVAGANSKGAARMCVRIELGLVAVTLCALRIQIANRAIRVVQETFVADRFELRAQQQVLGQNLRYTDGIAALIGVRRE